MDSLGSSHEKAKSAQTKTSEIQEEGERKMLQNSARMNNIRDERDELLAMNSSNEKEKSKHIQISIFMAQKIEGERNKSRDGINGLQQDRQPKSNLTATLIPC